MLFVFSLAYLCAALYYKRPKGYSISLRVSHPKLVCTDVHGTKCDSHTKVQNRHRGRFTTVVVTEICGKMRQKVARFGADTFFMWFSEVGLASRVRGNILR